MSRTDREIIEEGVSLQGYSIERWGTDDDGEEYAVLGWFVVLNDDYEDRGLYSGSVGELRASHVGAEKYGNRRCYFSFIEEGMDGGNEVHDLSVLDPVDP